MLVTAQWRHNLMVVCKAEAFHFMGKRLVVDKERAPVFRKRERSLTVVFLCIQRQELDFQYSLFPKLALRVISKSTERIKFSLTVLLSAQLQHLREIFGFMCTKLMFSFPVITVTLA